MRRLRRFVDGILYALGIRPIYTEVECPWCYARFEEKVKK